METLNKAFVLCVKENYTMRRIMADEHHVVAMSFLKKSEPHSPWFMSIFNLATCNESSSGGGNTAPKYFLPERLIHLSFRSVFMYETFLFDGWMVVPLEDEKKLVWFDKNGARSETITKWDSKCLPEIYSSGSSLLFTQPDSKILLKL